MIHRNRLLRKAALLAMMVSPLFAQAAPIVPPLPPPRPAGAFTGRATVALPANVPLPPARPADVGGSLAPAPSAAPPASPTPAVPQETSGPAQQTPVAVQPTQDFGEAEQVCAKLFASGKVVARASVPVTGPGGCGIAAPIELSAIVLAPGDTVNFTPPVEINCALGDALADWVREDVAPVFVHAGRPLTTLTSTSGYACRGRNRVVGAKLSEHGKGNAVDIGGFGSTGAPTIGVKDGGVKDGGAATPILAEIKRTACARFMTVLGPGSDGYHESHMHVDLEYRRNHSRFCHWAPF